MDIPGQSKNEYHEKQLHPSHVPSGSPQGDVYKFKLSIARLRGSVVAPAIATESGRPLTVALKKTSGLVQVATARLICVVKNVKPT